MRILGIEGMSSEELNQQLSKGAKFVYFQFCFSVVILTFKRASDIYFIPAGEGTFKKSIGFTLLSLVAGWWGFPWGPIYTLGSLFTNLSGGKDVTGEVVSSLNRA